MWAQARLGDQDARAELIESYRPYVSRLVARMGIPPTGVQEREDLVSAGVIGLIDAVDRFDHSRGVPFEAFARARIQGAVIDELRRLDGRGRHFWKRVRDGEIDQDAVPAAVSLDRLVEAGSEPSGNDLTSSVLEEDLWNDVGIALMTLPRRERNVLQRYYGASRTLREIGSEMGVSEARVCQLHARAIAQLRRMLTMRGALFAAGAA
jgi:RNA polymerase sigma factor for flagellar operon FliA